MDEDLQRIIDAKKEAVEALVEAAVIRYEAGQFGQFKEEADQVIAFLKAWRDAVTSL